MNCICTYTLIPVRSEPNEQAEMVTQLLFGELYTVIDTNEKWALIKITTDNYMGWIDIKLLTQISSEEHDILLSSSPKIISSPICHTQINNNSMPLVAGSLYYENSDSGFTINKTSYSKPDSHCFNISEISEISNQFINAPYLWGGKSVLGIDCSGLSQIVFKTLGIQLPRDASQQVAKGTSVNFINETKPGDLAFFDNDEGNIIHVGIILNNHQIIHASGSVRIDKIDHQGIFRTDTKKYSHKLRIIKRIVQ